jgi:hypothetical protein
MLDVHERHALGANLGVGAEHGRILLGERAADGRGTRRIECGHGAERTAAPAAGADARLGASS